MSGFKKATKQQAKLRAALIGISGSGKTYTALQIATGLSDKIGVIDTERGSASKYADEFSFDVLELTSYSPQNYIDAIHEAEAAGFEVLVIDSLSHAWMGKDGALELVDKVAKRTQSSNTFGAWREVTPLHNALVDAILGARLHVIVTMRAKTEYVQEKDERTGKTTIRKVGLAPVQRDGLEYEFDVVGDMDADNNLIVSKTRCKPLRGGVYHQPGAEFASILKDWLTDGAPDDRITNATREAVVANAGKLGWTKVAQMQPALSECKISNPDPKTWTEEQGQAMLALQARLLGSTETQEAGHVQ
jgi:hypothetical protein